LWLQYLSHKLARLAVPYAMLTVFAASVSLAERHVFYRLALAAQVAFYLLAGYGALVELRSRASAAAGAAATDGAPMREVA
jgi:hypothetical protein